MVTFRFKNFVLLIYITAWPQVTVKNLIQK